MLAPWTIGAVVFGLSYLGLRALEYAYHRLRHTSDWSPHWGTWVFALLMGVYVMLNEIGR